MQRQVQVQAALRLQRLASYPFLVSLVNYIEMPQGSTKLAKKAKSTTQKKVTPKDMKKGRKSTWLLSLRFAQLDSSQFCCSIGREIPPKKEALVARAMIQRVRCPRLCTLPAADSAAGPSLSQKNTSSHATTLEKKIATSAISHGKLTIMRAVAETSDEGRKEVLKRK